MAGIIWNKCERDTGTYNTTLQRVKPQGLCPREISAKQLPVILGLESEKNRMIFQKAIEYDVEKRCEAVEWLVLLDKLKI